LIQRLLARVVVAVLAAAAATLAVPATPAQAAYCSTDGVAVLVDFGDLGGGESTGCGSGGKASEAFADAGYQLEQHPRQQGFVCKVDGQPASGDCLQTDAYWAFFVSRSGGNWVYSSLGVYAQSVKAGDTVALVWQSSASRRQPGGAPWQPPAAAPTATPTSSAPAPSAPAASSPKPGKTKTTKPKPSKKATTKAPTPVTTSARPTGSSTTAAPTSAAGSVTETPAESAADQPTQTPPETSIETPIESSEAALPTTSAPVTSEAATPTSASDRTQAADPASDGGGLPGWLPPVLVVVLLALAGGVAVARRGRDRG